MAKSSVSASSADTRKKGAMTCYSPQPHYLLLLLYRWVCLPFLEQWKSITSNRFWFNMGLDHHLHLKCHPSFLHNLQQFNVKAATAHHSVIQKEVDELFVKGLIEPSTGGASFFSNVSVFPNGIGGLWHILNLRQFNHDMHISTFKMSTIRHVWHLIHHVDFGLH